MKHCQLMLAFGAILLVLLIFGALEILTPVQSAPYSSPKSFYVSPKGNDSWSGTIPNLNEGSTDGPFRTLVRAQEAMRSSTDVKTATLRAGVYALPDGLILDVSDSGETWIAYGKEVPVIDGEGTGFIAIHQANGLTIEGLTFQNMGLNPKPYAYGIVAIGSANNIIRWNKFISCRNSCFFGVRVTNTTINSNTIEAQSPGNVPGNGGNFFAAFELSNGSSNNRISHNLIENIEGGAIALRAGVRDLPNNNNTIAGNILRNVVSHARDCGAIHILDRTHKATGNKIKNNVIIQVGGTDSPNSWTKAIYLDDLTSNTEVEGNICYRGCGEYAVHVHGGDHNVIRHNIFDLSGGSLLGLYQDLPWPASVQGSQPHGPYDSPWMAENIFTGNIIYSNMKLPAPLWKVSVRVPQTVLLKDRNNLYFGSDAVESNTGRIVDPSPVYVNPYFADPKSGRFLMPAHSPAFFAIGFPILPTDQGPLPRLGQVPINSRAQGAELP